MIAFNSRPCFVSRVQLLEPSDSSIKEILLGVSKAESIRAISCDRCNSTRLNLSSDFRTFPDS